MIVWGGPFTRVDSALYAGLRVTTDYDSLLAKVIVWGQDRESAIGRMRRALQEFQVGGVPTDLSFLLQLIESTRFLQGQVDTSYLDDFKPEREASQGVEMEAALATALFTHKRRSHAAAISSSEQNPWRMSAWREQMTGSGLG